MSISKLCRLIDNAPRWAPADAASKRATRPLLVPLGDLVRDARAPEQIVNGLIERDTVSIWYGASETYKTFVLLDVALCIAAGIPWHGRAVKRAPVVLVVGEGLGGIGRRCAAWLTCNRAALVSADIEPDIRALPILVTSRRVSLFEPSSAIALGDAIARYQDESSEAIGLVGIDTVSKAMPPGNENQTSDMQAFTGHLHSLIREPTGAALVAVHHVGRGATDRMRGSYALEADTEAAVRFERAGTLAANVIPERCKDGEVDAPFSIRLEAIPLLLNGQECSSLAITSTGDMQAPRTDTEPSGQHERVAVKIIQALAHEQVKRCRSNGSVPSTLVVSEKTARDRFYSQSRDMKRDTTRRNWNRAKDKLKGTFPLLGGGFVVNTDTLTNAEPGQ